MKASIILFPYIFNGNTRLFFTPSLYFGIREQKFNDAEL